MAKRAAKKAKKEESKEAKERVEEAVEKPARKDKKNEELKWILIIMGVFLASVLMTYFVIQSMKHFEYQGLSFTKEKFGKLDVYHYYYFFNDSSGQVYQYNLFLRGDPRKNEVPVEGGKIVFYGGKHKYLSINSTGLQSCEDGSIAVAGLSSFLANNKIEVRSATPDKDEAANKSIKYASCATNKDDIIMEIKKADETKIFIDGTCYEIRVANCEILPATEKFIVQAIIDAKSAE